MKRISTWAKNHIGPARLIIAGSQILIALLGIITGLLLKDLNILLPTVFISVVILFFMAACLVYPSKEKRGHVSRPGFYYARQKSCDFVLAASCFCLIIFLSNRPDRLFQYSLTPEAYAVTNPSLPTDSSLKTYKPVDAFAASMKDENGKTLKWKERKKLLKEQINAIKKSDSGPGNNKPLLIILSVVAALGLLSLVASLSCSLSCNGSEAAALIVGIGGTALIIFLLVIAIKAIKRKKVIPNPDLPVEGG